MTKQKEYIALQELSFQREHIQLTICSDREVEL